MLVHFWVDILLQFLFVVKFLEFEEDWHGPPTANFVVQQTTLFEPGPTIIDGFPALMARMTVMLFWVYMFRLLLLLKLKLTNFIL